MTGWLPLPRPSTAQGPGWREEPKGEDAASLLCRRGLGTGRLGPARPGAASGWNGNARCNASESRSICHGHVGNFGTTCLQNTEEKECGLERKRQENKKQEPSFGKPQTGCGGR